jgi:hypothetical protein
MFALPRLIRRGEFGVILISGFQGLNVENRLHCIEIRTSRFEASGFRRLRGDCATA